MTEDRMTRGKPTTTRRADDPPHGTTYRYRGSHGCRCDDCCAAWRRRLEYERREPDDPADDDFAYARSHGIPEADVLAPRVARALHRGRGL